MDDIGEYIGSLTVEHILQWIISHRDNQEEMDEINKVIYPFSSKFHNGRNY